MLWRDGRKWLVGILAAGGLVMIAFGASDSERIALIAGVTAWLATYALGQRFVLVMAAIAIAGVLLTPLWVKTVAKPENLHAVMPDIRLSALQRTYMWDFAIDRTVERPILGWGFDTSRHLPHGDEVLETEIFHAAGTEQRMGTHPHNWFAQTWVELGAVGALLLAALIAVLGRLVARQADRSLQAAMAGCFGFALVMINLMWGMWQSWWLSSLGIAIVLFSLVGRLATESDRPSRAAP
jgi:O-antigen ligase